MKDYVYRWIVDCSNDECYMGRTESDKPLSEKLVKESAVKTMLHYGYNPQSILCVSVSEFDLCEMANDVLERVMFNTDLDTGQIPDVSTLYPEAEHDYVNEALSFLKRCGMLEV